MNNDGLLLDGQMAQENVVPVETAGANDTLQKVGMSDTSGYMSSKIKNMINAPDFRVADGFVSTDGVQKAMRVAWIPELKGVYSSGERDLQSDNLTIIKDTAKQFWMGLSLLDDKAQIALGNIASTLTGNTIGSEMRDRAYEAIDAAMSRISMQNTRVADVESLVATATNGALSMIELMGLSVATMGIAPMVELGVEAFGTGAYNNMIAYANEHGGSIDGYEGSLSDLAIDTLNAAAQVYIERKLGFGRKELFNRFGGRWAKNAVADAVAKEAVSGFVQESTQEFATDLSEYFKGNADGLSSWKDYMVAGAVGGLLQGIVGGAIHANGRIKADRALEEIYIQTQRATHPEKKEEDIVKEARSVAKQFNDDVERQLAQGTWGEFAARLDTNNDRGIVRDNLVKEFTKARVAALGLQSESELDPDDIADIQDATTIAAAEAVREAWARGISIFDTMTARLVADGNKLVVRDLKPEERGVAEKAAGQLETISIKQEKTTEEQPVSPARADSVRPQEPISAIASDVIEESPETQKAKRISDKVKQVKERKKETNKTTTKKKTDADRLVFEGSEYDLSQITREDLIRSENEKIAKYIKQKESERPKDNFESWAGKTNIEIADAAIKNNILPTYEKLKSLVNEDGVIVDSSENSEIANEIIKGIDWKNTLEILLSKYDILDQDLENWLVENFDNVIESFDESDMSKNPFLGYLDLLEREFSKSDYNKETQELMNKYEDDNDAVGLLLVPKSLDKLIDNVFQNIALQYQEETDAFLQLKDNFYKQKPEQILLLQPSLNDIASGKVRKTGRGAYDPRYQRIILNKDSDISTILHELSHMWLNNWFKAYRSENAPESFKKWWKPVEKALGIRESDRFLNKDTSEKFARGFEKWVMDGGKGGADSLQPVYDRLSKRLADIYDDLATRYFDMVADLKPEVNAWFAQNEYVADSMVVDVVDEEGVPTGETTRMEPTRNRAEERSQAIKDAEINAKIDEDLDGAADVMGDAIYGKATSGEEMESKISRDLTQEASAKGVHDDLRVMYDRSASKELADRALEFALLDFENAYQVAMGYKNVPDGLTLPSVFTAVRHVAKTREDGGVYLTALKNSPALQIGTKAGQALTQFKDYFGGSGVADVPRILKELDSLYAKNITKSDQDYIKQNVGTINDLIAKHDLDYDKTWESILNYMECK